MQTGETEAHRTLKRLALSWAIENRYRIAAVEVSLPDFRRRLDVAAYRPAQRVRKRNSSGSTPPIGTTVIFECKQSRGDFLKDSKLVQAATRRLQLLHERKLVYEEFLHRHLPSLRNGDSLFQEFETCDFSAIDYQPYERLLKKIQRCSGELHAKTKFDRITKRQAANLHYVVVEEGVAGSHELPFGWGLLVRQGGQLQLSVKPIWFDLPDENRFFLLQRIALAATRAVTRELDAASAAQRASSPRSSPNPDCSHLVNNPHGVPK